MDDEKDRIISSHELAKELAGLPPQRKFATGFKQLDYMTAGLREGDLVILSGLSGSGKTQLAISMINQYAQQDIGTLMFSYEISTQELFERFNTNLPLFYLPRIPTSSAPRWIEQKIVEAKKKYDTKIIFIDHLHYLIDMSTSRNMNSSEIIGSLVREFKKMARQQRVCIVLLCHVRKIPTKNTRPTIADLRDSSNIGNEADIVMLLHRTGQRRQTPKDREKGVLLSNDAWLYLDKVRHYGGQVGRIKMTFRTDGFYEEVDVEEGDEDED